LSWGVADNIRKIIAKSQGSEKLNEYKTIFIEGCFKQHQIHEFDANEIWDSILSFGNYGFNKSHAIEYSILAYYEMWCKVYYPQEFILVNLTFGSTDLKNNIIEEALKIGLDIRPPKAGKSQAMKWVAEGKILYAPYSEIKGIAETGSELIYNYLKSNDNGFWESEGVKISKGQAELLNILDVYNDVEVSNEFSERIKEYFTFSFSKDRAQGIRGSIELLKSVIKLTKIKKCGETPCYMFGQVLELSIKTGTERIRVKAILKDSDDYVNISFTDRIIQIKMGIIEDCEDQFIIVYGRMYRDTFSVESCIFGSEILSGKLNKFFLGLIKFVEYENNKITACRDCDGFEEKQPLPISTGKYNVMIVGERTSNWEADNRNYFGSNYNYLLRSEIEAVDFKTSNFYYSNIVKCFSAGKKKPGRKIVKTCSKVLTQEVNDIKPVAILSFGNIGLEYFTGEKSGITEKSGNIKWIADIKAWVCFCITPASTFYSEENKDLFQKSVRKFFNLLKKLK